MLQYGIPKQNWDIILSTIRSSYKVYAITLYGSRAQGSYKDGSDINLALSGPLLNVWDVLSLTEALDKLDLPWEIDLVVVDTIEDKALYEHIEHWGIVLD